MGHMQCKAGGACVEVQANSPAERRVRDRVERMVQK